MATSDAATIRNLVQRVCPEDSSTPIIRISNAIALYLASSPDPGLGPYCAQLPKLATHLRCTSASSWLDTTCPKLKFKDLLISPVHKGIFLVKRDQRRDVVELNIAALEA
ncbi:hypothetical protein Vretifemale_18090, partial [Volvox reticuliferus]